MNILVFVDHKDGQAGRASLEALGAAAATGATVTAVSRNGDALSVPAAKHVTFNSDAYSPDALARDIAGLAADADAVFFGATGTGRDLAPRVAGALDCAMFSDCTAVEDAGGLVFTRPTLAGKLITRVKASGKAVATLRRNNFPAAEGDGAAAEAQAGSGDGLAVLTEIAAKVAGKLDVSEAPVIVSGGRGLGGPEHFHLVEELAAAFGNAAVGASRAVVDAGWRPHGEQVGQTGKTVSPQLYIAVGISGAIQHVAGMKTAKVIVAINKDPEAPIFKLADYGLVGDAHEVLPALTEAIKGAVANA